MGKNKQAGFLLRMSPELRKAAEDMAYKKNMNFTELVRKALTQYIEEN
jgi:predicted HicB family RNase H-like nuclease